MICVDRSRDGFNPSPDHGASALSRPSLPSTTLHACEPAFSLLVVLRACGRESGTMTSADQLNRWLDDLCVRFIINLPREELESAERICFQLEEAQWFYEDFIRPLDPALPSLSLRTFCMRMFRHCPLLSLFSDQMSVQAFEQFIEYKMRVPVRGAILVNSTMDSVVLVKGWKKSAKWSFPRGKINKDEKDFDCAVREVYEETGFDVRESGLVPNEKAVFSIEFPLREQHMRMFVVRNVPMDTPFEARTRKEISVGLSAMPRPALPTVSGHSLVQALRASDTEAG